jgi:hypothetical protein
VLKRLHGENCAESLGIKEANDSERWTSALPLFEIARVLVRFDHNASRVSFDSERCRSRR